MELFQRMPPLLHQPPVAGGATAVPATCCSAGSCRRQAGQPFAPFLAEHIFAPLGLRSTSAGDAPGGPGMARGFFRYGQPVRSFDLGTASLGAGDVWSTADDLVRWDDALAAGELLTPRLRREMLTAHAPIPPGQVADPTWIARSGYGYGWFVGTAAGRRFYFHPGDNPGYLAFNAWLPDHDIRLAVLVNEETTDLRRLCSASCSASPSLPD